MNVQVHKRGRLGRVPLSPLHIKRTVREALRAARRGPLNELNIVFLESKTIRALNRAFLKKRNDTDVIAFPYLEKQGKKRTRLNGDIFISLPQAKKNAARYNQSPAEECARLVIHGTLHILGYSDKTPKEKKALWKIQERVFSILFPNT